MRFCTCVIVDGLEGRLLLRLSTNLNLLFAGKIPLRQLVYRVLDLPPSMRPLVYDFGQLNRDVECSYIERIVNDHVCRMLILCMWVKASCLQRRCGYATKFLM